MRRRAVMPPPLMLHGRSDDKGGGRKRPSSDQRPERPSQSRGHRIIATLASAASFEIGTGDRLSVERRFGNHVTCFELDSHR